MIYCTENHIVRHKNDPTSYWEDKDYASRPNGKQMAISVDRGAQKPGFRRRIQHLVGDICSVSKLLSSDAHEYAQLQT